VFAVSGFQHAMCMQCACITLSSVACAALNIFLHYLNNNIIKKKKKVKRHKLCFDYHYNFRLKHSPFYEEFGEISSKILYLLWWLKNKRPTWCHLLFYFTSCVLNTFRTLIYPSSGACDYSVELPHWLYCSWFDVCWSFGVVGLEWYPCCRLSLFMCSTCFGY